MPTSTFAIGPASAAPALSFAASADPPAIKHIGTPGMALGAFAAGPVIGDGFAEQCGDGIVALLEACGEGKAWPYASAGSVLGVVLGGLRYAEARRIGDTGGMQAGLFKIALGGLGAVAGAGLFAAHPALQGGLETIRTVLGTVTLPSPVATHRIGTL